MDERGRIINIVSNSIKEGYVSVGNSHRTGLASN